MLNSINPNDIKAGIDRAHRIRSEAAHAGLRAIASLVKRKITKAANGIAAGTIATFEFWHRLRKSAFRTPAASHAKFG